MNRVERDCIKRCMVQSGFSSHPPFAAVAGIVNPVVFGARKKDQWVVGMLNDNPCMSDMQGCTLPRTARIVTCVHSILRSAVKRVGVLVVDNDTLREWR